MFLKSRQKWHCAFNLVSLKFVILTDLHSVTDPTCYNTQSDPLIRILTATITLLTNYRDTLIFSFDIGIKKTVWKWQGQNKLTSTIYTVALPEKVSTCYEVIVFCQKYAKN